MKTCTKCHRSLPLTMFYKNRGHADGLLSECAECFAKRNMGNRVACARCGSWHGESQLVNGLCKKCRARVSANLGLPPSNGQWQWNGRV